MVEASIGGTRRRGFLVSSGCPGDGAPPRAPPGACWLVWGAWSRRLPPTAAVASRCERCRQCGMRPHGMADCLGWPPWLRGREDPLGWWSDRGRQCHPSTRVGRFLDETLVATLVTAAGAVPCSEMRRRRDLIGLLTTGGVSSGHVARAGACCCFCPPMPNPPHSTLTTSCWRLASATRRSMGTTGACGRAPRATPSCPRRRPSSPNSSVAPPSTRLQQAASCWPARSMRIPAARSTMMRVAWYVCGGGDIFVFVVGGG